MLKNIYIVLTLTLFSLPAFLLGMDNSDQLIKIQTNDDCEFETTQKIVYQSNTLKNLIQAMDDEDQSVIPLPEISGPLFINVLKAMEQLVVLNNEIDQTKNEKSHNQCLNNILATLNNEQPLNNNELINFFCGVNYLDVEPMVEPALKELSKRVLNVDGWRNLSLLGDKLKDLWQEHPAKKLITRPVFELSHTSCSKGLSKNDNYLIAVSYGEGMVKAWNMSNLSADPITLVHSDVEDIVQSKDGNYLISRSSSAEGMVKVWNMSNLSADPITLVHSDVEDVVQSKDGDYLISRSSSAEGTIKIWDMSNFSVELITLVHSDVKDVIQSKNGNYLISRSLSAEGTVKVWNMSNFSAEPATLYLYMRDVIWTRDGNCFISYSKYEDTIEVWDMENLDFGPIILEHFGVGWVMQSKDSNCLISYSRSTGIIKIWDMDILGAEPTILEHPNVYDILQSKDGNYLISYSYPTGIIKVWDMSNLGADPTILEHCGAVDITQSKDGDYLISKSWSEGTIKIWYMDILGAEPTILEHPKVSDILQSEDGSYLISRSNAEGTIKVWDMNNLGADSTALKHPSVERVFLSKDGSYLIAKPEDTDDIKVWDIESLINQEPNRILFYLAAYFSSKTNQPLNLELDEKKMLKLEYDKLSPLIQAKL